MNEYTKLKDRHQKEVDDFPFFFAFYNEQFEKGMASFGLAPTDTDKIYRLGGTGGFFLRTDAPRFKEIQDRYERERQDAIATDTKGTGYIYQMFLHELANHDYGYTLDLSDTLDALGMTIEEIRKNKALSTGLDKAINEIKKRKE